MGLGGTDGIYHVLAGDEGLAGARFDESIKSNSTWEVDLKGETGAALSTEHRETAVTDLRTTAERRIKSTENLASGWGRTDARIGSPLGRTEEPALESDPRRAVDACDA